MKIFNKRDPLSLGSRSDRPKTERKPLSRSSVILLFVTVGLTVAVFTVYRFLMQQPYFVTALYVYLGIACASLLCYVMYNRGFSRRGVTVEMLPDTMSEEQKQAFVEDAAKRMKRSRWLLAVVFAFFVTIALDLLELYALPLLKSMLGR